MVENLSDLSLFCRLLWKEWGPPGALSEEEKADEFRRVYFANLPVNLSSIMAVAKACGIKLVAMSGKRMPRNVRGYHDVIDSTKTIYYRDDDTASGIENTILHEIREMMENIFAEICPEHQPLRTTAVHLAANRFATAVLLPRKSFERKMYETGLDVVALANFYQKSCSQVLLRIGEVLQGRLFFYGALYEPASVFEPTWLVTYWTRSWNDEFPEANVCGLDSLFPKRGHQVMPGSLVSLVIMDGGPYFARRITILDDEEEGLVALAQPFAPRGDIPSKVVLIVTLSRHLDLLQPQLERTKPRTIKHLHQHL